MSGCDPPGLGFLGHVQLKYSLTHRRVQREAIFVVRPFVVEDQVVARAPCGLDGKFVLAGCEGNVEHDGVVVSRGSVEQPQRINARLQRLVEYELGFGLRTRGVRTSPVVWKYLYWLNKRWARGVTAKLAEAHQVPVLHIGERAKLALEAIQVFRVAGIGPQSFGIRSRRRRSFAPARAAQVTRQSPGFRSRARSIRDAAAEALGTAEWPTEEPPRAPAPEEQRACAAS